MFSSIAPWLSNSANIASNSAKSVAALTPVIPVETLPLVCTAANNHSVPKALPAPLTVPSAVEDPATPKTPSNIDIST